MKVQTRLDKDKDRFCGKDRLAEVRQMLGTPAETLVAAYLARQDILSKPTHLSICRWLHVDQHAKLYGRRRSGGKGIPLRCFETFQKTPMDPATDPYQCYRHAL